MIVNHHVILCTESRFSARVARDSEAPSLLSFNMRVCVCVCVCVCNENQVLGLEHSKLMNAPQEADMLDVLRRTQSQNILT